MSGDALPMHQPAVLQTEPGPILAMVTEPTIDPVGVGVVFFSPGGYTISAQRNRWAARMAEQLAARGLHTIRFDYHGIGDSAADLEAFNQHRPLVDDAAAAIAELERRGITELILVGQCFGARTALAMAPQTRGLRGVFGISPPVRDLGRGEGNASRMAHDAAVGDYVKHAARIFDVSKLRDRAVRRRYARMGAMFVKARWAKLLRRLRITKEDPTPWVSRLMIDQMVDLADRAIPVSFVYGAAESDSSDYEEAKVGALGDAVDRVTGMQEHILEGRVHNLGSVEIQEAIVEMIVEFAVRCAAAVPDAH